MNLAVDSAFAPWASLSGGALIGFSSVMKMGLFGRIAGISGIANGFLGAVVPRSGAPRDTDWRLAFLLGLIMAPLALMPAGGTIEQTVPENLLGMAVAGLLVGLGSALGSGCTSGHGPAGWRGCRVDRWRRSRPSWPRALPRSSSCATYWGLHNACRTRLSERPCLRPRPRHLRDVQSREGPELPGPRRNLGSEPRLHHVRRDRDHLDRLPLVWRRPAPALESTFDVPTSTRVDRPLIPGATLFGVGWGIGGFCPGPAWTALPLLAPGTLVFLPAMLAGLWVGSHGENLSILNPKGAF